MSPRDLPLALNQVLDPPGLHCPWLLGHRAIWGTRSFLWLCRRVGRAVLLYRPPLIRFTLDRYPGRTAKTEQPFGY